MAFENYLQCIEADEQVPKSKEEQRVRLQRSVKPTHNQPNHPSEAHDQGQPRIKFKINPRRVTPSLNLPRPLSRRINHLSTQPKEYQVRRHDESQRGGEVDHERVSVAEPARRHAEPWTELERH